MNDNLPIFAVESNIESHLTSKKDLNKINSKIPHHTYRVESEDFYEPKDLRTVICTSYNNSMRLPEAEEITSEEAHFTNQEFSSLNDIK